MKEVPLPKSLPRYRRKVNRLLFRLVNFYHPALLVEVGEGNGGAFRYMCAARPSMKSVTMKGFDKGDTLRQLNKELSKAKSLDFLHIGFTLNYMEAFEAAHS